MADLAAAGDEAAACRARLDRNLDDLDALRELGFALLRQGRGAEAVAMLADVAARHPSGEVLNDLGGVLRAVGLHEEAQRRFNEALAVQPDLAVALCNAGSLLLEQNRAVEALPVLRRALDLQPALTEARHALCAALLTCGNHALGCDELDAAEAFYREAIGERPDFAEALNNLGNTLVAHDRLEEAVAAYRTALALRPDSAETAFSLSLALLAQGPAVAGAMAEGWRLFEARRRMADLACNFDRRPALPKWQPDTLLEGRHVLLMSEQGRGDVLQYLRYAPLLAEAGVDVVLELPDELCPLGDALPGVRRVVGLDDPAPECDLGLPLLSLPLIFGTTPQSIPARVPYLAAPPARLARWQAWLGPAAGRRIGLVCSGNKQHPHDYRRGIALERLAPLLAVPDTTFVLLQPDLREGDLVAAAAMPWLRRPTLGDFGDTAALMMQMDLVVSIDTSAAHLAGALGLPVWLLLPYSSDYRWNLSASDSPWYPTMRLYRQSRPGGWDDVIETVRRDLGRRT
ncbi:MAG: tetratricopeptide repeat protein [Acetobacteraceae bacterium]|nr:tetratricopeptide repeat protein [Acetobacteraceae bacterium]